MSAAFRRSWLLALAAGALLLPAAPAAAAETPPTPSLTDEFSAADQYVESVPTARGPKAPGVGKQRQKKAKLSQPAQAGLESQPEQTARKLEEIATSPELGAPVVSLDRKDRKRRAPSSVPRVPAATVSAVGEGEEDTLKWLAAAMIVIAATAAGTTAHRHYKRRDTAG